MFGFGSDNIHNPKYHKRRYIRYLRRVQIGSDSFLSNWIRFRFSGLVYLPSPIHKNEKTRHGHSGSQSGFGFIHSGFGFSSLSKSTSFGLYKSSVQDRYEFYRVRVGVSKSSKNWYNPLYFRVRIPIGYSV